MFDGKGDCSDWSDECPTSGKTKQENILASRYEVIGNPFLRALLWIMGLLATVGNAVSHGTVNCIRKFEENFFKLLPTKFFLFYCVS